MRFCAIRGFSAGPSVGHHLVDQAPEAVLDFIPASSVQARFRLYRSGRIEQRSSRTCRAPSGGTVSGHTDRYQIVGVGAAGLKLEDLARVQASLDAIDSEDAKGAAHLALGRARPDATEFGLKRPDAALGPPSIEVEVPDLENAVVGDRATQRAEVFARGRC